jgi:hypothetical protein
MNKKKLNKIVLAMAFILLAGPAVIANDKLPRWKSAQEEKAIAEVLGYLKEKQALEALTKGITAETVSVKVVDTEGNLLEEVSFTGSIDWTDNKEMRNLIGRSEFVMEHQNTMYYVFTGDTEKQVRS